jgi:ABC-2 type transport system ATP-binding protein
VSLTAEGGKALGLLGRNGAGKTTTIRIIMRVFSADSGQVLLDGEPLDTDKIKIGYLPEERGLYPKKEVMTQLVYFGELAGLSKKQARSSAEMLLEKLQVSQYANQKLETLSKGNAQKIQLAATLMCNPQIVILDEPCSGLDPVNARLLKDVIKETINDGAIVLFSSHQMNYIEEFCDDIAILNSGRIALSGNIGSIKRSYPRDRIRAVSSEPERLSEYLLKRCGDNISSLDSDEKDPTNIFIKIKEAAYKTALLKALSESDIDIDCFEVCEPTLNDIFVEYTEAGI